MSSTRPLSKDSACAGVHPVLFSRLCTFCGTIMQLVEQHVFFVCFRCGGVNMFHELHNSSTRVFLFRSPAASSPPARSAIGRAAENQPCSLCRPRTTEGRWTLQTTYSVGVSPVLCDFSQIRTTGKSGTIHGCVGRGLGGGAAPGTQYWPSSNTQHTNNRQARKKCQRPHAGSRGTRTLKRFLEVS